MRRRFCCIATMVRKRALRDLPPRRKYKKGKRKDPIELIELSPPSGEDGEGRDKPMMPTGPTYDPLKLTLVRRSSWFTDVALLIRNDFMVREVLAARMTSSYYDDDVDLALPPGQMDVDTYIISDHSRENRRGEGTTTRVRSGSTRSGGDARTWVLERILEVGLALRPRREMPLTWVLEKILEGWTRMLQQGCEAGPRGGLVFEARQRCPDMGFGQLSKTGMIFE
ncbi:hypothetical protein Dimus_024855, partial [Dionaea muscipula]